MSWLLAIIGIGFAISQTKLPTPQAPGGAGPPPGEQLVASYVATLIL